MAKHDKYTYHCSDDGGVNTLWDLPIKMEVGTTFKAEWGEYKVTEIRGNQIGCDRISKETM